MHLQKRINYLKGILLEAMSTSKKTIAIDMDGVIADTVMQFISWYEKDYGIKVGKDVFEGKPEIEALPDGVMKKIVLSPGFFRNVPVMEGAQEAVLELMEHFDVYIVSAAMEFPQSLVEKYEWLKEHFPFVSWHKIIFCGDKSVIGTDYMIDDHVRNLDCCKGKTLMFTAGHNTGVNHHTRVNNWQEVMQLLKKELQEK
jgi:5'(3')-deoxyribonucleotidase